MAAYELSVEPEKSFIDLMDTFSILLLGALLPPAGGRGESGVVGRFPVLRAISSALRFFLLGSWLDGIRRLR